MTPTKREMAIKHEGLHARRLAPSQENPREIVFAKHWRDANTGRVGNHTLMTLLTRIDCGTPFSVFTGKTVQLAPYDQQSASVAATVVQWLGSNVGFSFMQECLHDLGFEIVKRERP